MKFGGSKTHKDNVAYIQILNVTNQKKERERKSTKQ